MSFKRARSELASGSCDSYFQDEPSTRSTNLSTAGIQFREFLISKYSSGTHTNDAWPASDICVAAYWATEAGAEGVSDLAMHPKVASKHASEHLKFLMSVLVMCYCV
jgi:hypothetical protein